MRRVCYSVAMSLDGFIAGPQGEFDWIPMDPTLDWKAFMARFDTVLMGRKTWEITGKGSGGGGSSKMRTFVFSETLRPADQPNVTVVNRNAGAVVNELRNGAGKDIWLMGGGNLFRSLLEADQVDAVEVGLVPVLLGRGLPLLAETSHPRQLRLNETKSYPNGTVMLHYEVSRETAKRRKR